MGRPLLQETYENRGRAAADDRVGGHRGLDIAEHFMLGGQLLHDGFNNQLAVSEA